MFMFFFYSCRTITPEEAKRKLDFGGSKHPVERKPETKKSMAFTMLTAQYTCLQKASLLSRFQIGNILLVTRRTNQEDGILRLAQCVKVTQLPQSPEKSQYLVRLFKLKEWDSHSKTWKFERVPELQPLILVSAYDVIGSIDIRKVLRVGPGLITLEFGADTDLPFGTIGWGIWCQSCWCLKKHEVFFFFLWVALIFKTPRTLLWIRIFDVKKVASEWKRIDF